MELSKIRTEQMLKDNEIINNYLKTAKLYNFDVTLETSIQSYNNHIIKRKIDETPLTFFRKKQSGEMIVFGKITETNLTCDKGVFVVVALYNGKYEFRFKDVGFKYLFDNLVPVDWEKIKFSEIDEKNEEFIKVFLDSFDLLTKRI